MNTALNFAIPFSFMGFYYTKVLKSLHSNRQFCLKSKLPSSFRSKHIRTKRDKEINVSWTILIVLVGFVLCWVPFLVQFILVIVHNYAMGDQMQLYFVTVANMFYFLGCGINPLILIFRCAKFKHESTRIIVALLNRSPCVNLSLPVDENSPGP